MKMIVIDAGHFTGQNQSPTYPLYIEGNRMWVLAEYLKEELSAYECAVVMTRASRDKDLLVYDRGQCAKDADLFLSLHSNAANVENVRRVVVIPPHEDKFGCHAFAHKMAVAVSACMGVKEDHQLYTRTYIDGNGKTQDYYGVIRGAVHAGCYKSLIIEHSFHTNKESAAWLNSNENLKKLAKVEAAEIAGELGLKKKGEVFYRVQVGAYKERAYAEAMKKELEDKGYQAFIVTGTR